MRTKSIIGRKIVKVIQRREWFPGYGKSYMIVDQLVLDNGTIIYPTALETEGDVVGNMNCVTKRTKEAQRE